MVVKVCFLLWLIAPYLSITHGLDNGLALTPPMGWMHWQRFRCVTDCDVYPDDCIREDLFRAMADHMAQDGFLEAGYHYVMIDDCWTSKQRNNHTGRLEPDPQRFPSGIKALADYVHSKGLKLGIYADYGTKTCAGYPGSLEYLELDAQTFADWEVDYLKFDGCYSEVLTMLDGYDQMSEYLNKTGRPIVYSCSLPAYQEPLGIKPNYEKLAEICNLWRNWDDIDDAWSNVTNILKWFGTNQDRIASFSGPGHWNDPDMLIIGNYGLSYEQSKAQMAIWAILAAPLIMSVDLRTIEPKFREILLNKDIIGINQDALGIQGRLITTKDKVDIWVKPIEPIIEDSHTYAIGFLSHRVDGYPYRLNFTLAEINLRHKSYTIQDIYEPSSPERVVNQGDLVFVRPKPSGGVLLKATPISTITANQL
ncbi:alpha-N-acetylgalactosaminidase-like [Cylas formicarius]|uniref:alpha-N-acetylgalactosaminidase-like n=1 Tax=Cylas formicarius TaxID=197179 RepID=UPI002958D21E|nr:alpha-N-acetylgalactosaminidase-like [Cylas formicarius]XP_060524188.1 alpha-N-acetylgalactosaminidase-like [Cylas formicarius]XP_060524197.1 alpha-N-acetylgalactosaminidase-like [Cylas formicarius]